MTTVLQSPLWNGQLQLDQPIGQRVLLQGLMDKTKVPIHVDWLPSQREAMEIEMRALVVTCNAQLGSRPIIRYEVEVGHGESTWSEPQVFPNLVGVLGTRPGWLLPGRGVSIRLAARQCRINFWIENLFAEPPAAPPAWVSQPNPAVPPQAEVMVSFMPVFGAYRPVYPTQDLLPLTAPGYFKQIPITANEWRIRDQHGAAFAPAADIITAESICFGGGFSFDASVLADWTPIPWYALCFSTAAHSCQVNYR